MIVGAHAMFYSRNADADRAFLRDVFGLAHVDAGEGWLIFGLPPAEVGVHPSDSNGVWEFYLLCDDVEGFVAEMALRGAATAPIQDMGWGLLTHVQLPGGGNLGVYEPRHPCAPEVALALEEAKPSSTRTPAEPATKAKRSTKAAKGSAKAKKRSAKAKKRSTKAAKSSKRSGSKG